MNILYLVTEDIKNYPTDTIDKMTEWIKENLTQEEWSTRLENYKKVIIGKGTILCKSKIFNDDFGLPYYYPHNLIVNNGCKFEILYFNLKTYDSTNHHDFKSDKLKLWENFLHWYNRRFKYEPNINDGELRYIFSDMPIKLEEIQTNEETLEQKILTDIIKDKLNKTVNQIKDNINTLNKEKSFYEDLIKKLGE